MREREREGGYIYIYIYYVCVCVCVYIYIYYAHVCVCVCIYIYIYVVCGESLLGSAQDIFCHILGKLKLVVYMYCYFFMSLFVSCAVMGCWF